MGGDEGEPHIQKDEDISIHAPRVGGDLLIAPGQFRIGISIHAPRVGGDRIYQEPIEDRNISIHAPRVGGDGMPG